MDEPSEIGIVVKILRKYCRTRRPLQLYYYVTPKFFFSCI